MSAVATAPSATVKEAPSLPAERLERLCDPGSFGALRTGAVSPALGERAAAGDGVLAGAGTVSGRPVFCYAQDPGFLGGSLGAAQAESIVRVMGLAADAGAPVVGFVESGGARLQEGHDALAGYGRIFRASVDLARQVPQITVVSGVSAGGGAYSPALTDFVVMTESARMFLTGPRVVEAALGERISMEDLGGPAVHSRNGVCDLVAADDADAIEVTRQLLGFLPGRIGDPVTRTSLNPPYSPRARTFEADGGVPDPARAVPDNPRKVYDVRDPIRATCDPNSVLELKPGWARNMVTAMARIDGRPVGVIANQPRHLGGVIDTVAAEKGALFVDDCDRFGLPLVVLVDTPGFMPGARQEQDGVIRHGAALLRSFAAARVPKLTVVLRKAYGGAVITMNSKDLGADMVFAWPGAEIGIMAARQAVEIVHRRAVESGEHDPAELADSYAEEHLSAERAAASGYVDEVIDPVSTRARLRWALGALERR